jgi:hypothetical protein
LEPNLAGMFLGWFSTKFLFFVPVGYSTWLPGPIICSDWLKFQRSSYRNIFKGHNSVNVKGICAGFLLLVYICIAIGELIEVLKQRLSTIPSLSAK